MTTVKQPKKLSEVFPIVDQTMNDVRKQVRGRGERISCRKGCSYCCHLLVEVTWEEAEELARWILDQPEEEKRYFIDAVRKAARERRRFFGRKKSTDKYKQARRSRADIPDRVFDEYFISRSRPCPFLIDGSCAAYSARPVPCRLHIVSSPATMCSREAQDDSGFKVPREVSRARKRLEPVLFRTQDDGRFGELSISVSEALRKFMRRASYSRAPDCMGDSANRVEGESVFSASSK